MRSWMLLMGCLALLAMPAGMARAEEPTYVTTPEGEQVRLQRHWFGVPYAPPKSSPFPVEKYSYYEDAEGNRVLHGRYSRSYHAGRDVEFTHYVHGVKHGPFRTLSPARELQSEGTYVNGELDGQVTFYYPSGAVKRVEHYTAGVLNGEYRAYYRDGTLEEASTFTDGRKEGAVTWYHPNGEVAYRGTYRDGYLSGPFLVFDPAGHKRAEGTLDREWIVGDWRCFAPDGDVTLVRDDCNQEYYTRCSCP